MTPEDRSTHLYLTGHRDAKAFVPPQEYSGKDGLDYLSGYAVGQAAQLHETIKQIAELNGFPSLEKH